MAANNGTRDSLEWIKGKAAEGRARAAETPRQMVLPGMEEFMRAMPNQVARSSLFAGIAAFKSKTPDAMTNNEAKPGGKGLALSRQENKLRKRPPTSTARRQLGGVSPNPRKFRRPQRWPTWIAK